MPGSLWMALLPFGNELISAFDVLERYVVSLLCLPGSESEFDFDVVELLSRRSCFCLLLSFRVLIAFKCWGDLLLGILNGSQQ